MSRETRHARTFFLSPGTLPGRPGRARNHDHLAARMPGYSRVDPGYLRVDRLLPLVTRPEGCPVLLYFGCDPGHTLRVTSRYYSSVYRPVTPLSHSPEQSCNCEYLRSLPRYVRFEQRFPICDSPRLTRGGKIGQAQTPWSDRVKRFVI